MTYRLEIDIISGSPIAYRRILEAIKKMLKKKNEEDISIRYVYLVEDYEEVST